MRARRPYFLAWGVVSASVAACSAVGALWPSGRAAQQTAPRPAEGLWAILDPGCGKPRLADPRRWPKCAQPFWIDRDQAVVVRSHPADGALVKEVSYHADYRLAGLNPMIAQVGNARDGYLFLALTKLDRDDRGRLVAAMGAAFACGDGRGEIVATALNRGGCEGQSRAAVRRAAEQTLKDSTALAEVAWIASGAPDIGPKAGSD